MKKIILSIVLLLAIVATVASCGNPNSESSPQETPKTIWETLQELSQKQYSKVKLDIKTVTGDMELNANYVLTNDNVTYSVEQFNLLPADGNLANASQNQKTTLTGTATIQGGKVEKIDGENVTLPSVDELKGAFHFTENNFKNVKTEDGKLIADVNSASAFMGVSQNLSNMKIVVTYNDTALQKLEITYNTTNSMVTTVYEFIMQ